MSAFSSHYLASNFGRTTFLFQRTNVELSAFLGQRRNLNVCITGLAGAEGVAVKDISVERPRSGRLVRDIQGEI